MGFVHPPAEGASRARTTDSPMPHTHVPQADAAPRSQAAPFSLLRVGVGPRLAAAALLALALWGLIGWAMA